MGISSEFLNFFLLRFPSSWSAFLCLPESPRNSDSVAVPSLTAALNIVLNVTSGAVSCNTVMSIGMKERMRRDTFNNDFKSDSSARYSTSYVARARHLWYGYRTHRRALRGGLTHVPLRYDPYLYHGCCGLRVACGRPQTQTMVLTHGREHFRVGFPPSSSSDVWGFDASNTSASPTERSDSVESCASSFGSESVTESASASSLIA